MPSASTRFWTDIGQQHALDQPAPIVVGCGKRASFNAPAENDDNIGWFDRIGDDPQLGRPTKQRRARTPRTGAHDRQRNNQCQRARERRRPGGRPPAPL